MTALDEFIREHLRRMPGMAEAEIDEVVQTLVLEIDAAFDRASRNFPSRPMLSAKLKQMSSVVNSFLKDFCASDLEMLHYWVWKCGVIDPSKVSPELSGMAKDLPEADRQKEEALDIGKILGSVPELRKLAAALDCMQKSKIFCRKNRPADEQKHGLAIELGGLFVAITARRPTSNANSDFNNPTSLFERFVVIATHRNGRVDLNTGFRNFIATGVKCWRQNGMLTDIKAI